MQNHTAGSLVRRKLPAQIRFFSAISSGNEGVKNGNTSPSEKVNPEGRSERLRTVPIASSFGDISINGKNSPTHQFTQAPVGSVNKWMRPPTSTVGSFAARLAQGRGESVSQKTLDVVNNSREVQTTNYNKRLEASQSTRGGQLTHHPREGQRNVAARSNAPRYETSRGSEVSQSAPKTSDHVSGRQRSPAAHNNGLRTTADSPPHDQPRRAIERTQHAQNKSSANRLQRQSRPQTSELEKTSHSTNSGTLEKSASKQRSSQRQPLKVMPLTAVNTGESDLEILFKATSAQSTPGLASELRVQILRERAGGDYSRYISTQMAKEAGNVLGPLRYAQLALARTRGPSIKSRTHAVAIIEKHVRPKPDDSMML